MVFLNTNAAIITPHVALQLVKPGLAKFHISLDSIDQEVQGQLFQGRERLDAVLNGIYNVQIAREALGVSHPEVHINCVLTARNLFHFPDLLRFLLEIRPTPTPGFEGKTADDPAFHDFAFHLIPVGGTENAFLRPTAGEWKQFYTETWVEAERVWEHYQETMGVQEHGIRPLEWFFPFASPYLRAEHRTSLDEYCEEAALGHYWGAPSRIGVMLALPRLLSCQTDLNTGVVPMPSDARHRSGTCRVASCGKTSARTSVGWVSIPMTIALAVPERLVSSIKQLSAI